MSAVLEQLDTFGPQRCEQLTYEQADEYTRRLARTQYENFTVVSWLLPVRLRADFQHVYAFCRWADDLGDETGDTDRSHELLAWWRDELTACYQGDPRHPVFVALAPTIEQHDIPRKPFDDLIDAFVQDQTVTRYDTWDQAIDYCTRSADPVGRLVLYLCGYRDAQRQQFSDATCTALQLINFWQDVRRDIIERDRVYVPRDIASKHGLDVDTLVMAVQHDEQAQRNPSCGCPPHVPSAGIHALLPAYKATIRELVERTQPLFERGKSLWPLVSPDVRVDVELFTRGGEAIARMIHRVDYDTLQVRPSLGKAAKVVLMMRAAVGKLLSPARAGRTS
jgi:squalene synthase HpnC